MIREYRKEDLDGVMKIWLEANLSAHSFLPETYWKNQEKMVRRQIPEAEVYVWEEAGEILGFTGLQGEEIAGIFVREDARGRGIGASLLDFARQGRNRLFLYAYEKNRRARSFYERQGFREEQKQTDQETGEAEYRLAWEAPVR